MPLTIVEIIKQAEQGLSSPFLCRGDDGDLYFVKGRASFRPADSTLLRRRGAGGLDPRMSTRVAPLG